ncbi:hypothetical protein H8S56_08725 [Pseudomonas sp. DOAB1067]|uniref:Uncharacterized protein n=1 Tax=Pseudomonas triticifolii TaxID=2762592 RepID=A0ABR7BD52_9PSED|nr:hypothetical protein [Pseudomonas triticifolii]
MFGRFTPQNLVSQRQRARDQGCDEWSAPLFERICDLFDWDQKHDVHSGTPSLWMHLIERCEKKAFVIRPQQLLEGPMDSSPAHAAHSLLDPPTLKTGGWAGFKHYWARNTGRWVMITLSIMLIFVIAVILSSPDPRH